MMSAKLNRCIFLFVLSLAGCGDDGGRAPPPSPSKTPAATGESTPAPSAAATPAPEKVAAQPSEPTETKMAPTPGTTTRDTELKDKPFIDAKTLKTLPGKTAVTIVDRSGGWFKVVVGGQQGWVRLLHVSSQPAGAGGGTTQEIESVAKMATGRAGGGNIVSTTGIRGLSEEQLRKAQPNPAELKRLEGEGVTPEQASAYARAHKLERRQVAQLPEPK